MQRCLIGLMGASLLLLLAAGCAANKRVVILMPDPDGHLGAATVTTAAGTQLLDTAGAMTVVTRSTAAPSLPVAADPHYVTVTFADALAVAPQPPEKFILFFETGTTTLVSQSQPVIAAILDAVTRRGALSVAVSGHTDTVGSNKLNDQLAQDRADAIKQLLLSRGVDPDRLTVTSHGKGNPLVPTPDNVAEPKNRRVEVIVR
jgi:outer membrane protein OmpA-like peptidoglycan-associated protein